MQRTGVFGSAFNPPTRGHLDVLRQAASEFDTILLVPSAAHAFSKQSLPIEAREELLSAFCKDIKSISCEIEISLIEKDLYKQNPEHPVYTWTLLNSLSEQHPDTQFSFIRGPDNASQEIWERFYRYQDIEQRWPIFTAQENIKARSTLVRQLIENSPSNIFPEQELSSLVTPSVLSLLREKKSYRTQ
ncbi:adenylyltransferase/cytidyltransferase family protein [Parendozoicomonas sp. Alg238-R29]|uniref:adenylyltransferase/cytidyltransferase family protein n=1 Tax=Parendozoicomonas sp. Alg238-R29 TaxID=2993446 RepID=UPI00248DB721|nr:adenylyltransferase/cytidyltransferase family protein [Parendozoicomonas sp. Alg238-R29]